MGIKMINQDKIKLIGIKSSKIYILHKSQLGHKN